jgi:limonene-1,2-epoxide hydrolase
MVEITRTPKVMGRVLELVPANQSAEAVVRAFIAAWPRWQADELADFLAADATWVDGHNEPCTGRDVIRARLETVGRLVPGPTAEILNLLACGGTVMVERVDTVGVKGETFHVEVTGVFDVDAGGRIVRWRDYYDSRTLNASVVALLRTPRPYAG